MCLSLVVYRYREEENITVALRASLRLVWYVYVEWTFGPWIFTFVPENSMNNILCYGEVMLTIDDGGKTVLINILNSYLINNL